jgi:hypothetical protein
MNDPLEKSAGIARLVKEMVSKKAPLARALEITKGIPDPGFKTQAMHEIIIRASARGDKGLVSQCVALLPEGLREDDKRIINYFSSIQSQVRNAFPLKKEAERKEFEKRKEKVERWINLLEGNSTNYLSQPLFRDLQAYIQSLNSKSSANDIFNGLIGAAEEMADMLIKFKKIDKGIE